MNHIEWLNALADLIGEGQPLCPVDGDNCVLARQHIARRLRTIIQHLNQLEAEHAARNLR